MARSKNIILLNIGMKIYEIEIWEVVWIAVLPCLLKMHDHSIIFYWVIKCCGWVDAEFDCPDKEAALGVRIYSLRKPVG